MSAAEGLPSVLAGKKARWLITGGAGFIGSHLVEQLLLLDQEVVTLDNFSTGRRRNLEEVQRIVGPDRWARHSLIEGDIVDTDVCRQACSGVDYVLHQAALGSVPRSIKDPVSSNLANVNGFVNIAFAAKEASVRRLVFASSSSVYGDHPELPKVEEKIGRQLSPYAVTKYVNELYASVFGRCYGLETIGLRYFNVFGARQDPEGPYAAVIPRWVRAMLHHDPVKIFGDGETSRDFCYVLNAVEANLRAALTTNPSAYGQVFNVAVGTRTSLLDLYEMLRAKLAEGGASLGATQPEFAPFREGDVRHSLADTSKARTLIGYQGTFDLGRGLDAALPWYVHEYGDRRGA